MKALVIQDLTKTYQNKMVALKGISFSVEQGDFFALLGPNGAGKSTTIGIIASLVNKTSGKVNVFGYDIDCQLSAAKACIGLVPQEFNCNIFEKVLNILIQQAGYYGVPANVARSRAEVYLKELGLWSRRDQLARELSGGLKRRLMIARALMHEPKLLILDEPTAGVDIELRRSLWVFIEEVNRRGTTVILTTHYLEEAEQLCRNVAIIDHGNIIENASMKHILTKLHVETFIFYLETPVTESLMSGVQKFSARLLDEYTLEIDVHEGQILNEVFDFFSNAGVNVKSMRNKANRLEELFIHLTSNVNKVNYA